VKVEDIMTRGPYTCRYTESLQEAAAIMAQHDCGCVPVVDGANLLVGMITDRDICVAAQATRARLEDLKLSMHMNSRVHTCRPEDDLASALEVMRQQKVRRLGVTEPGGRVAGLLSIDDIALRGSAPRVPGGVSSDELEATWAALATERLYR
jgi:CBS domain-containing protein